MATGFGQYDSPHVQTECNWNYELLHKIRQQINAAGSHLFTTTEDDEPSQREITNKQLELREIDKMASKAQKVLIRHCALRKRDGPTSSNVVMHTMITFEQVNATRRYIRLWLQNLEQPTLELAALRMHLDKQETTLQQWRNGRKETRPPPADYYDAYLVAGGALENGNDPTPDLFQTIEREYKSHKNPMPREPGPWEPVFTDEDLPCELDTDRIPADLAPARRHTTRDTTPGETMVTPKPKNRGHLEGLASPTEWRG